MIKLHKLHKLLRFSLLFLIGFLVFSQPSLAQEQRFRGGLVGGFNLSQLDGDKLSGYNKIGLNLGAKVNAILSDRWLLSIELLYVQQGSSRTLDDDPSSIFDRINISFVEAPILITFKEWKFDVSAGFSYAGLFQSKVIDFSGVNITDSQDFTSNIINFVAGITYNFDEKYGLNIRWSRAINDLRADAGDSRLIGRTISIRGIYWIN